jgi:hypothetical protein
LSPTLKIPHRPPFALAVGRLIREKSLKGLSHRRKSGTFRIGSHSEFPAAILYLIIFSKRYILFSILENGGYFSPRIS